MGRSPCYEENGLKKGPWTPKEDQKLVHYIQKHGHGSWRALINLAGIFFFLPFSLQYQLFCMNMSIGHLGDCGGGSSEGGSESIFVPRKGINSGFLGKQSKGEAGDHSSDIGSVRESVETA
ncbi:hypothetical protein IEQ34_014832 [Dendrobium chrysotoxum]|uniref:Uncharacterized protein n=1 Tax=Dendrobium chrysotoxum TaxID=161865 RepID=A0AAV7GKZ6_DENCH|nr:hypothetical protein IEQ34_014832 [Dendrobium chrysotoxum]